MSALVKKCMVHMKGFLQSASKEMKREHQGAVGFEYVIVLVSTIIAIFTAWNFLSAAVIEKAEEIAEFIRHNGQRPLGTGS